MRYKVLLFILFTVHSVISIAQIEDVRKTESDIKVEDRFVAAKLLVASGKKNEAIRLLDTLRRESEPSAAIFFELAKLHYENKDLNQTESNLRSALKLEPDNVWIRRFEYNFSKDMGRMEEAGKTLLYLSKLQPKNPEYYDQLVALQIQQKQLDSALLTLTEKEKNIGYSSHNVLKRAEILDNAGKLTEAIDAINTLVAKYPGEKKYLHLITGMLHSNDKIAETEPYLKKILELDPNDNDAKLGLILLSKNKGTREDYLVTLFPLISNPDAPIDMKIKELMPHVIKHASTGDTLLGQQLIDLCDKLVIAHPNDAKSHAVYGDVLKNNGEMTAAVRQYEKTLSLNNKNFLVWEQLMYCIEELGNVDLLLKTAREAIDYFPNQAISYYFAGKAYISKKEEKSALSMLEEASMIAAGNPNIESRVLTSKAEILFHKKEYKKAMSLVDEAWTVSNQKNASACELKGDIFKASGDAKNAVIHWQKAIELGGQVNRLEQKIAEEKNN